MLVIAQGDGVRIGVRAIERRRQTRGEFCVNACGREHPGDTLPSEPVNRRQDRSNIHPGSDETVDIVLIERRFNNDNRRQSEGPGGSMIGRRAPEVRHLNEEHDVAH